VTVRALRLLLGGLASAAAALAAAQNTPADEPSLAQDLHVGEAFKLRLD